jgi:hypothetical protein
MASHLSNPAPLELRKDLELLILAFKKKAISPLFKQKQKKTSCGANGKIMPVELAGTGRRTSRRNLRWE